MVNAEMREREEIRAMSMEMMEIIGDIRINITIKNNGEGVYEGDMYNRKINEKCIETAREYMRENGIDAMNIVSAISPDMDMVYVVVKLKYIIGEYYKQENVI